MEEKKKYGYYPKTISWSSELESRTHKFISDEIRSNDLKLSASAIVVNTMEEFFSDSGLQRRVIDRIINGKRRRL